MECFKGATTFNIVTLSIMTFSIMTLSIKTFSIMTLRITALSIMSNSIRDLIVTLGTNDIQHNEAQHNGI